MTQASTGVHVPSPIPYDFSGLRGPMTRAEARERRRRILAGRSLWSALEIEHWAGLFVVGGVALFLLLPAVVVLVIALVVSAPFAQTPGEQAGAVLVGVGAPALATAATYFSIRALLIPPRWRAWVRMHRFAEQNGLEFVREEIGTDLPGTLRPQRTSFLPPRLYDAIRDPARGIVVGDWVLPAATPRGFGDWHGVILVRRDAPGPKRSRLGWERISKVLGDAAGSWSIEIEALPDDVVAMKSLPFRMRRADNFERALRMAWAVHQGVAAGRL